MTIYSIYKITNLINGKCYVGFTGKTVEERFRGHKQEARRARRNYPLYNAMKKYGTDSFSIEIVYQSTDRLHTLNEAESQIIKNLEPFYNLTPGGECAYTPEGMKKAKLTKSDPLWKQRVHSIYCKSNKGKGKTGISIPHSEETKKKLSDIAKQRKRINRQDGTYYWSHISTSNIP